jgi:hypothetical protein
MYLKRKKKNKQKCGSVKPYFTGIVESTLAAISWLPILEYFGSQLLFVSGLEGIWRTSRLSTDLCSI